MCPECGEPVANTTDPILLQNAGPEWRHGVRRGLALLAALAAFDILRFIFFFSLPLIVQPATTTPWIRALFEISRGLTILVWLPLLVLVAVRLTRPPPQPSAAPVSAHLRRTLLGSAVALLCLRLFDVTCLGRLPAAPQLSCVSLVLDATVSIGLGLVLLGFAHGIRHRSTVRWGRAYVLFVSCSVVPHILASTAVRAGMAAAGRTFSMLWTGLDFFSTILGLVVVLKLLPGIPSTCDEPAHRQSPSS